MTRNKLARTWNAPRCKEKPAFYFAALARDAMCFKWHKESGKALSGSTPQRSHPWRSEARNTPVPRLFVLTTGDLPEPLHRPEGQELVCWLDQASTKICDATVVMSDLDDS